MNREGESFGDLAGEFASVGRIMFEAGLNNSHSGNMSVRLGDRVLITRRRAMLGRLTEGDLVDVGLKGDDPGMTLASREVMVHRAVYTSTSYQAIVHTHPKTATAFSMFRDYIVPVDEEGQYYFKRIPVLEVRASIGSVEVEKSLPALLRDSPVVMVRGHGAFAAGESLEEGLQITHSLEWSCEILMRCLLMGMTEKDLMEDRTSWE